MTGSAAATMQQVDWKALEARVRKLGDGYRVAIWRSVIGLMVTLPLIVLFTMDEELRTFGWILGVALGVFIVGRTTIDRRRWLAEAHTAAQNQGDLLAFWRKDLDRRISLTRFGPVQAGLGLLLLTPLVVSPWAQTDLSLPRFAGLVAMTALVSGQGLWSWLRQGPRLRRERAQLG